MDNRESGPSKRRDSGPTGHPAAKEEASRQFAKPSSRPLAQAQHTQPEPSSSRPSAVKPSSATKAHAPRKAVPPGYLHDLLHSRHLMKTVGLRKQTDCRNIPNPLAGVPVKTPRLTSHHGHGRDGGREREREREREAHVNVKKRSHVSKAETPKLPELFQQRKLYLDRRKDRKNKKRREEGASARARKEAVRRTKPADEHADDGDVASEDDYEINLLSLPEELLLKIVCYLTHEEAMPLFLVCKELNETLKNAIKFHFNFATPMAMAAMGTANGANGGPLNHAHGRNGLGPLVRRPQKKRAVTAYADVLGHLKKGGQRNVIKEAPSSSTHSLAAPRALMFNTPQTTPTSLQQQHQQQQQQSMSMVSIPEASSPAAAPTSRRDPAAQDGNGDGRRV